MKFPYRPQQCFPTSGLCVHKASQFGVNVLLAFWLGDHHLWISLPPPGPPKVYSKTIYKIFFY